MKEHADPYPTQGGVRRDGLRRWVYERVCVYGVWRAE